MKVLILTISYAPNVGGVETHLSDWVRFLGSQEDMEVDVLTYQPITTKARGLPFEQQGRVRIFRISWFGRTLFHRLESKPIFQFLYLAPRLLVAAAWHMIRRGRCGIIHAQGLAAIWTATMLKKWFKIPVLGSIHAVYSFPAGSKTANRITRILKKTDRTLALSDASLHQLLSYGVSSERLGRFTYWIDLQVFSPQPIQEARLNNKLPTDRMICLFVGRLLKIKGLEILFGLARLHPEFLFITAGEGPMEKECIEASRTFPNFRHLGCLFNLEIPTWYHSADVLLVPSLYEEGFGRVVCEALACGLPVIASNRGGLKEAVGTDTGILVEPTLDAFSNATVEWQKKGGLTPAIRQTCRTWAEKNFSLANAQAIENHLRQLAIQ